MAGSRVLLTGFQSFQGNDPNTSELVTRYLPGHRTSALEFISTILPVTYQGCREFSRSLNYLCFDAIVMMGVSSKIDFVTLEKRAVNQQKATIPDNQGEIRNGEPVIPEAPFNIDTDVDVRGLAQELTSPDFPVRDSLYAGTFVCNTLYFHILNRMQRKKRNVIFAHVPKLHNQWTIDSISQVIEALALKLCKPQRNRLKKHYTSVADAEKFLHGFINLERKTDVTYTPEHYNLNRFTHYLQAQASPHTSNRYIHIAGTKGKGTVSAIVASILSKHGFRTGLYTSPHLVDIRERIRLDGKAVSERDFVDLADEQYQLTMQLDHPIQGSYRTTFELLTAMAFQYFRKQQVEWAVLETGMGGRLDCTNVVHPVVSAISRIDLDHTESLGDTMTKIAREKAGIIKAGVPVVSGRQVPVIARFLKDHAIKTGSDIVFASTQIPVKNVSSDTNGTTFSAKLMGKWFADLKIHLPGLFQFENCRLALGIIQRLAEVHHIELDQKALMLGLSQVRWPGRFTIVDPRSLNIPSGVESVIIDGAHNPMAIRALMASAHKLFPQSRFTVLFGCSKNKDAAEMLKILHQSGTRIMLTSFNNSRASSSEYLRSLAEKMNITVQEAPTIKAAVNLLQKCIMSRDVVIATGSLFLAGEFLEYSGLGELCRDIY